MRDKEAPSSLCLTSPEDLAKIRPDLPRTSGRMRYLIGRYGASG
ncbi:MAG: hypothetical protein AVDCRST_MAG02-912 [uncultured Rubrobacteraceae bacterium]|uniref:Uncharacterized protein n=1 Tax=uncultured Rubrobacteraceae bacterium TaxID=349277 RepID=A0A6J4QW90_9ACTN|nr:MAG: hypothetical protein AVDCRST_MAG02-912 [uncultured Rubrobacteraceae bacterium]